MHGCNLRYIVIIVFLVSLILWTGSSLGTELKVGQRSPAFELQEITGDSTYTSKELFPQSRLTILILWTTHCDDCTKALKGCRDLASKVKEKDVRVVGINCNTSKLASVRGIIKGEKIDFVNLSDFQTKVARSYFAEPYDFSTFIVDSKSIIRYVSYDHPPDVADVLLKKVEEILGEEKEEKPKDKSKESKDSKENKDRKV